MRTAGLMLLFFAIAPAALPGRERERRGDPGKFDYYVLSLSWSPQFCASNGNGNKKSNEIQCGAGRQYGFIVHGLWPQYERGFPQFCSTEAGPPRPLVDKMLDIMPAPGLIRHEWDRHGVCDGSNASQYFGKVRSAWSLVKIPEEYKQPIRQVMVKPLTMKRRFGETNGDAAGKSFAVQCGGNGGRFLTEVRVCLDRQLRYRACSAEVRDSCRVSEMIVPLIR